MNSVGWQDLQINVYQKYHTKPRLLTLLSHINLNFGKQRESDTSYLLALTGTAFSFLYQGNAHCCGVKPPVEFWL
jgi:hypothetical protein